MGMGQDLWEDALCGAAGQGEERRPRKRDFRCDRCRSDIPGPVLLDNLWKRVGSPRFMCLGCVEAILGRPIVRADLKPIPFNGYFGRWIDP